MTVGEWRQWAAAAGTLRADGPAGGDVLELTLDSRAVERGEVAGGEAVFFAVRGVWYDGHDFLRNAFEGGVRRFVVREDPGLSGCDVVVVADVVEALQGLAAAHRRAVGVTVVAVTGSNGKTVVKEWAAALLARRMRVGRSPRSYNSQVGVPLSVWGLAPEHEVGVIEVGISEPGEMAALAGCVEPRWGVLTHLGEAHAANFPSRAALVAEKLRLFEGCDWVALPGDCAEGLDGLRARGVRVRTWGVDGELRVLRRWSQAEEVEVSFAGEQAKWQLPAPGELTFRNAMTAALTALCLGVPMDEIAETLPHLPEVDLRMQRLSGPSGTWIISDAYANDWGALAFALRDLGRLPTAHPRGLILGDLPGAHHDHHRLAELLEGTGVSRVWLIGSRWHAARNVPTAWRVFERPDEALTEFRKGSESPFHGHDVLVKGPRSDAFETFVPLLCRKGHATSLVLDLDAVTANVNAFRKHIRNTPPAVPIDHPTRIIAVVKASGYGTNGPALARALEQVGMSHLAVACTEEGVQLRRHGIALPIVVLNPDPSTFDALLAHRLEPELIGPEHCAAFCAAVGGAGPWPVHIKIDTGMHRLGFTEAEVLPLAQLLADPSCPLRAETVLSHLASADEPEQDGLTLRQFRRFHRAASALRHATDRSVHPLGRHICNSAGIARFPEQALEFARLGIGMFGVNGHAPLTLQPALSFQTTVSQLRTVPAGEGVGYGATDVSDRPRRIATLPVGYADGYPRHLSNGVGHVAIGGQLAPVVGRVCMDMTLVDVTGLRGVSEGDDVVLFGQHPTLEDVAEAAGTIPYELIARIPPRVARIHRGG